MTWDSIKKGVFYLVVALLVVYLGSTIYFYWGTPQPAVDYGALLNQAASSSRPADRAWPIYREAWAATQFGYAGKSRFDERYQPGTRILVGPGDGAAWQAAIEKLGNSQRLLDALRAGGAKPALGLHLRAVEGAYSDEDYSGLFVGTPRTRSAPERSGLFLGASGETLFDQSLLSILLPHLNTFGMSIEVLRVDTRWALEQGDTERAVEDVAAMFGMARQVAEVPIVVTALAGAKFHRTACETVIESVEHYPGQFDEPRLARLQQLVQQDDVRSFFDWDGGVWLWRDLIQRIYTDDGHGDGRITPDGLAVIRAAEATYGGSRVFATSTLTDLPVGIRQAAAPISLATVATRREMMDKVNQLAGWAEEDLERPFYELPHSRTDQELKRLPQKFTFLQRMFLSPDGARQWMQTSRVVQRSTALGLAAWRYKKLFGQFPGSSKDLTDQVLAMVPRDPFDGKPIRYLKTEDGFLIYSVGPDRDDDRCKPVFVGAIRLDHDMIGDGDWLLWPLELPGSASQSANESP